jgi:phosphoribosylanthranilate isomerase
MTIEVKVCGLTHPEAVTAAAEGGARFFGFVFYPPSPRSLDLSEAARLAALVPEGRTKVGVLVDPSDADLASLLRDVPLDYLQLHGSESPARVAAIRQGTGLGVMKALSVADRQDLAMVPAYAEVSDMLLFDAKPPSEPGRLPGGNGLAFDWRLLRGLDLDLPWLLSGGLSAENLAVAVQLCRARTVDVSSGVEQAPGLKDPARIRRFLEIAARLDAWHEPHGEPLRQNA